MCDLRAEARSHDPKFRERIVKEIHRAFERAVAQGAQHGRASTAACRSTAGSITNRFGLPRDEPCVVAATAAVDAEDGEPELAISNGGLDANWLTAHGIPTVTLGCGQRNIHTVERGARHRRVSPGPADRTSPSHRSGSAITSVECAKSRQRAVLVA